MTPMSLMNRTNPKSAAQKLTGTGIRRRAASAALAIAGLCVAAFSTQAQTPLQTTFPTPELAAKALVAAVQASQQDKIAAILGPEMMKDLNNLSPEEQTKDAAIFLEIAKEKVKVEPDPEDSTKAIAYFGAKEWPFPAPLVKQGGWHFDGAAGVEEMHDRLIGSNELNAIDSCYGYVEAQKDYASDDWMDDGVLQYAQRVVSTQGKKDGLYWSNADGGPLSPLGPFIAETGITPDGKPQPYQGYYFKILTAQGDSARGGARSYIVDGRMVLGFALVGWPAEYGKTGVYTFIVNQLGVVYQKDLGAQTSAEASAITKFDPDKSWQPVSDDD
jgi:hypothetical protein